MLHLRPAHAAGIVAAATLIFVAAITCGFEYFAQGPPLLADDVKQGDASSQFLDKLLRQRRAVGGADCRRELPASSVPATLTSPGYPDNYPNNLNCRWLIVADKAITLRITALDIEEVAGCRLDYLQVYLGANESAPALDPFCGTLHGMLLETNSSTLLLRFRSDSEYVDKGFSIDYFTQAGGDCPSFVSDESGSLTSARFPGNYPDDSDCWTLISVGENRIVILTFDAVDLEAGENCTFDYVEVFDGKTKGAPLLSRLCQESEARSFQSSSNSLLVHFHSDDSVSGKGFEATYKSVDSRLASYGGCTWNAENGTIASPGYPEPYPKSANCSFWILAPEGSTISFEIEAMALELDHNCSFDFLLISEASGPETKVLGLFCGLRTEPKSLNSTRNEVRIQFQSDDMMQFSGFLLHYRILTDDIATTPATTTTNRNAEGLPSFSTTPSNVSLSEGSSAVLSCDTPDLNARIRWLKGGLFLAGKTPLRGLRLLPNNSLLIESMGRHLTGVYTCVVVSPDGEVPTYAFVTMPNSATCEVEFKKMPSDAEFEEHTFAFLECVAEEDDGVKAVMTWEKDGRPLRSKDHVTTLPNGYLYTQRIRAEDAGLYTCVARDLATGCVGRASARITVNRAINIQDVCGRSPLTDSQGDVLQSDLGKIVDGSNAREGAYPWLVMLWVESLGSFCGGALLNEWWVVTAAHCIEKAQDIRWDNIRLLLGKHKRLRGEESEVELLAAGPSSFKVHPEFEITTFDNDIALVRLATRARFSHRVLPLCLAGRNETEALLVPGTMGMVMGWGKLKEFGSYPLYLQEIALPIVDQESCVASTKHRVTRNMFCAGYNQEVIGDACQGDSGSPFIMKHEGRWYMVGLVSWGEGCGKKGSFGFYTRIANHISWIQGVIKP